MLEESVTKILAALIVVLDLLISYVLIDSLFVFLGYDSILLQIGMTVGTWLVLSLISLVIVHRLD